MNQSELARKLGISRQRVSQLVAEGHTEETLLARKLVTRRNKHLPSFETRSVSEIAKHLGIARETLSYRLPRGLQGNRQDAIWLSFDIESTGPVPGSNALLSLGVVAYDGMTFEEIGSWEANLSREWSDSGLSCGWDEDTLEWWHAPERKEAFDITMGDPKDPKVEIPKLVNWLASLRKKHGGRKLIWAAWPSTFDMPFVNFYCYRFARTAWFRLTKDDPMQRVAAFDMKSYMVAQRRMQYHGKETKNQLPAHWDVDNPLPHVAINDARAQGQMLMWMLWETGFTKNSRTRKK